MLKRSLEQILLVPREGRTADRGLLVFLHGRSDDLDGPREQLAADLRRKVRVWPGEHDGEYWHSHMDAYLRFYARALAACR